MPRPTRLASIQRNSNCVFGIASEPFPRAKWSSNSNPVFRKSRRPSAAKIRSADLQRRRIALTVKLDQAMPSVIGDRIQLQQVILNLVLNAADALGSIEPRPRQIK